VPKRAPSVRSPRLWFSPKSTPSVSNQSEKVLADPHVWYLVVVRRQRRREVSRQYEVKPSCHSICPVAIPPKTFT
jgi:hypothetical protein